MVPEWADDSTFRYYTEIEGGFGDSVRVMRPAPEGDTSDKNPGTLHLRLVPSFRRIQVVSADGREQGVIRPRPLGLGYDMWRDGDRVWTISNRSIMLRRHALSFADGRRWSVRTPFYWWLNILCTDDTGTRVLGQMGPFKWLWMLWFAPGDDSDDVLSALAFMHRRWWRR